ncbi:MAG: hypothetical protein QOF48_1241 [Verrucomicrobiota bacterium]|jgi:DNA-directed RNA polymerase specialized sigma24 family protein
MMNHRRRALFHASLALAGVWIFVGAGWAVCNHARVTGAQVAARLHETDLTALPPADRSKALDDVSRQMAALPVEERRKARLDEGWQKWLAAMSDPEKAGFVEATLPGGFQKLIANFEQLPEDKRRRFVSDALRELKKAREAAVQAQPGESPTTNRPPDLNEELQQKLISTGIKSLFNQGSAQTKAELAPVLEELQRLMENGALLRNPRR